MLSIAIALLGSFCGGQIVLNSTVETPMRPTAFTSSDPDAVWAWAAGTAPPDVEEVLTLMQNLQFHYSRRIAAAVAATPATLCTHMELHRSGQVLRAFADLLTDVSRFEGPDAMTTEFLALRMPVRFQKLQVYADHIPKIMTHILERFPSLQPLRAVALVFDQFLKSQEESHPCVDEPLEYQSTDYLAGDASFLPDGPAKSIALLDVVYSETHLHPFMLDCAHCQEVARRTFMKFQEFRRPHLVEEWQFRQNVAGEISPFPSLRQIIRLFGSIPEVQLAGHLFYISPRLDEDSAPPHLLPRCNGTLAEWNPVLCVEMLPAWSVGEFRCSGDDCSFMYGTLDNQGRRVVSSVGEEVRMEFPYNYFPNADYYSPDVFFLSAYVLGQCEILKMMHLIHLAVKLIYVPINPAIPPPIEFDPGPEAPLGWEGQCSLQSIIRRLQCACGRGKADDCCLSKPLYRLWFVDIGYAVFVHRSVAEQLPKNVIGEQTSAGVYEAWLAGWRCRVPSQHFQGLDRTFGRPEIETGLLANPDLSVEQKLDALCSSDYFLRSNETALMSLTIKGFRDGSPFTCAGYIGDRSEAHFGSDQRNPMAHIVVPTNPALVVASRMDPPRAHCFKGLCECLPPWRGWSCSVAERGHPKKSAYPMALHYLTSNDEGHMEDFKVALDNLWLTWNQYWDFNVIIFYDSFLSVSQRKALARASQNRVWFVTEGFSGFDSHPANIREARNFPPSLHPSSGGLRQTSSVRQGSKSTPFHHLSPGYRQVCRFESGPVAHHPALAPYKYTTRLDTDGYFPAELPEDEDISSLLSNNDASIGTTAMIHIPGGRANTLPDLVRLFRAMHSSEEEDAARSNSTLWPLLLNFETIGGFITTLAYPPYVFDLDFFRSDSYQEWWRFVDAIDGFERVGWLGNAVITAGTALLGKSHTYWPGSTAHQTNCFCGASNDIVCVALSPSVLAATGEAGAMRYEHVSEGGKLGRGMFRCLEAEALDEMMSRGFKCTEFSALAQNARFYCDY